MSPTDSHDAKPENKKARSRAACKQCRQAKVRCGMDKIPCVRCKRRGFDCTWDPGFKRSNNPDRFQHLEGHIRALEQKVGKPAYATPASSKSHAQMSVSPPPDRPVSHSTLLGDKNSGSRPPQTLCSESHAVDASCFKVLDIKLSRHDAQDLFVIYFEKYHHYMPILEESRNLDAYYESSDLLFWTIISIGARTSPPERDFLAKLSPFLTTAVAGMLLGDPIRLSKVQALVLLSLWPASNVYWWTDRSYVLSSYAVTAATYLGLHAPFFEHEYTDEDSEVPEEERLERTRTWLGCVIAAQWLATDFGYIAKLPFAEQSISSICDGSSPLQIPKELRQKLMLTRLGYFASEAISSTVISDGMQRDDDALSSLLEKFDQDLPSLDQGDCTLSYRLQLLAVRLKVLLMYFHLTPGHPARKPGVYRAYSTASELVNTLVNEDTGLELLIHSPRTTFRILSMAATVIFKVLHSSYSVDLNYEAGKALYSSAYLCAQQQNGVFPDSSLPRRVRNILRELWGFGENDSAMRAEDPILSVRTRLSASMIYDCMAIWRSGKQGKQAHCLAKGRPGSFSGSNMTQNHSPQSDGFDFQANLGDVDNVVADYLPFQWNPVFNDSNFFY